MVGRQLIITSTLLLAHTILQCPGCNLQSHCGLNIRSPSTQMPPASCREVTLAIRYSGFLVPWNREPLRRKGVRAGAATEGPWGFCGSWCPPLSLPFSPSSLEPHFSLHTFSYPGLCLPPPGLSPSHGSSNSAGWDLPTHSRGPQPLC